MAGGQLGNDRDDTGDTVNDKHGRVVVGVVRRNQKETNGDAEQKLLARSVLVTIVELLPHGQVVISARVEFKGNTSDVVEHYDGADNVRDIGKGPTELLVDTREKVVDNLQQGNNDKVDGPSTLAVDPGGVQIGKRGLVRLLDNGLGFKVRQNARRASAVGRGILLRHDGGIDGDGATASGALGLLGQGSASFQRRHGRGWQKG